VVFSDVGADQGHGSGQTPAAPFAGRFEWFSLLVMGAAFLALWRYKIGVIPVIGACPLAGLGYSLVV
jgi:chromate transporter